MSSVAFLARAIACLKITEQHDRPGDRAVTLPDDQAPVVRVMPAGLGVVYLVDEAEQLKYVQQHHLDALDPAAMTPPGESVPQPAELLHQIGLANLAQLVQRSPLQVVDQGAHHGLLLDGQFEASLALLDQLWDVTLVSHTPNGAVIAIPSRDVLAFCDAASREGVQQLEALVERVSDGGAHLLTRTLYQRVNGGWVRRAARTAAAARATVPPPTAATSAGASDSARPTLTTDASRRSVPEVTWHVGHAAVALAVVLPPLVVLLAGSVPALAARVVLVTAVAAGLYGASSLARKQRFGRGQTTLWMLLCGVPLVASFAGAVLLLRSRRRIRGPNPSAR